MLKTINKHIWKLIRSASYCNLLLSGSGLTAPETEFVNEIFRFRFLCITLRAFSIEVSIKCLHYKPVLNHFCSGGGGVKSVCMWIARRRTLKLTFVPITSKNTDSGSGTFKNAWTCMEHEQRSFELRPSRGDVPWSPSVVSTRNSSVALAFQCKQKLSTWNFVFVLI